MGNVIRWWVLSGSLVFDRNVIKRIYLQPRSSPVTLNPDHHLSSTPIIICHHLSPPVTMCHHLYIQVLSHDIIMYMLHKFDGLSIIFKGYYLPIPHVHVCILEFIHCIVMFL